MTRSYDLTLTSSKTNRLADFFLTEFDEAADSLSDFQNGGGNSLRHHNLVGFMVYWPSRLICQI